MKFYFSKIWIRLSIIIIQIIIQILKILELVGYYLTMLIVDRKRILTYFEANIFRTTFRREIGRSAYERVTYKMYLIILLLHILLMYECFKIKCLKSFH